MYNNSSDKEISESFNKNDYFITDYFRSPQKYFLAISILGVILSTLAQHVITSFWIPACIKSLEFEEYHWYEYDNYTTEFITDNIDEDNNTHHTYFYCNRINNCNNIHDCPYIYNCSNLNKCSSFGKDFYFYYFNFSDIYNCTKYYSYNEYTCQYNLTLFKIINAIGCLQFLIVIILLIIYCTCWKGIFFTKLIENPIRRYLIFGSAFLIYLAISFLGIITYYIYHDYIDQDGQPDYKNEAINTLIFSVIQLISLVLFLIGLALVQINKSDREVIENNSELSHSLVRNSGFGG